MRRILSGKQRNGKQRPIKPVVPTVQKGATYRELVRHYRGPRGNPTR